MLVEELLEQIVGGDNVSRHYFRFMQHIQKLPRLKIYVQIVDGEATITNVEAFTENLKRYVRDGRLAKNKIAEGVNALYRD